MGGIDASAMLRPGVYILRSGTRVVWIGAAKRPAQRVYAHLVHKRGQIPLPNLPKYPVTFDAIEVRPCTVDNLAAHLAAVSAELGWSAS